jgi:DNA-binding transcriptional ArsR family regulator
MTGDGWTPHPLEWISVVRSAQLIRPQQKLAALIVASYADVSGETPGASIYLGVARLAVDLQTSYATAQRHLAWLRQNRLIVLVRRGSRRRGQHDEYRLNLELSTAETLGVPNPETYRALCGQLKQKNRAKQEKSRHRRTGETSLLDLNQVRSKTGHQTSST